MTCANCSRPIPDELLACALCTQAASTKALRQFQYAPLRTVIAGLGQLTTRRIEHQRHVQMLTFKVINLLILCWSGCSGLQRLFYSNTQQYSAAGAA
jgi:hypothetical protein